jgi:hypothetical protein
MESDVSIERTLECVAGGSSLATYSLSTQLGWVRMLIDEVVRIGKSKDVDNQLTRVLKALHSLQHLV